jgi:hypothetical protein
MKLGCVYLLLVLLFLTVPSESRSQQSADSALLSDYKSNLRKLYLNEIGDNAQIYHGSEYIRNGQPAGGFPYYASDKMLPGKIRYNGMEYADIDFRYDLSIDALVIYNFKRDASITLDPDKINSFVITGHTFKPLLSTKSNELPVDGYYEELYFGDPGLYARREKKLVLPTGSDDGKYVQYNSYYILLHGVYYPVEDKRSLVSVLKDHTSEINKYARANKLDFKKNLESSLILLTTYYSGLKP